MTQEERTTLEDLYTGYAIMSDAQSHRIATALRAALKALDRGREAIRLLDLFMQHSRIEEPELATVYSDMLALLRRCREGA